MYIYMCIYIYTYMQVTCCRTAANRYFHVQCRKCKCSVQGFYGSTNVGRLNLKTASIAAIQALEAFCMTDCEDDRHVV